MAIFGKQRLRLLREKWKDRVDPFAEELFALLGSDEPLEITGPVTITNNTSDPALTITQAGPFDAPAIQITHAPEPAPPAFGAPGGYADQPQLPITVNVPELGQYDGGSGPGFTPPVFGTPLLQIPGLGDFGFTVLWPDGLLENWDGDRGDPTAPGNRRFGGKVTPPPKGTGTNPNASDGGGGGSGGGGVPGEVVSGSGDTYQVRIYPDGLDTDGEEVEVTQLQIDDDASIPAGTWAIVTQMGEDYFMQVPVWL